MPGTKANATAMNLLDFQHTMENTMRTSPAFLLHTRQCCGFCRQVQRRTQPSYQQRMAAALPAGRDDQDGDLGAIRTEKGTTVHEACLLMVTPWLLVISLNTSLRGCLSSLLLANCSMYGPCANATPEGMPDPSPSTSPWHWASMTFAPGPNPKQRRQPSLKQMRQERLDEGRQGHAAGSVARSGTSDGSAS
jgi:hypothetical protein